MSIAARFQNALDRFWHDTQEVSVDVIHYFNTMTNETRILFFVMFIMTVFYMIVRRPNDEKASGSMGRQFAFAMVIVVIFGLGIGWAMDHAPTQITRI